MKNKILPILFSILLFACSENDIDVDQFNLNCETLKTALLNFNSDEINFEINKLTQDLLPTITQNDEIGHFKNLNTLIDRINSNCDDIQAVKICYACIETLPVQSEIKVEFNFQGTQIERIIDISTPNDGILLSIEAHNN